MTAIIFCLFDVIAFWMNALSSTDREGGSNPHTSQYALVAQLKERFATNEKVGGLSPSESAIYQGVAGIGYGPRLDRGICRFESCHPDFY